MRQLKQIQKGVAQDGLGKIIIMEILSLALGRKIRFGYTRFYKLRFRFAMSFKHLAQVFFQVQHHKMCKKNLKQDAHKKVMGYTFYKNKN